MLRGMGVAALAALPLASAHISMKHPVPFDTISLQQDRSPLTPEQYPCKFQSYSATERTELAVGQQYTLDFYPGDDAEIAAIGSTQGAAVHDGGSCQLSITYDKAPTAKSVFKVFHSIQGGCPGYNQKTSSFQYSIPKDLVNGEAILAWTWFPVSSYAPEMYMNCAPVTISGASDDTSAFDELPDIFVANLGFSTFDAGLSAVNSFLQSTVTQASLLAQGQLPQCLTQGEHVLEFPNPGTSLATGGSDVLMGGLAKPQGQCAGSSSKSGASSSGSSSSGSSSSASSSSATTVAQTSSAAGIFAEAPSSSAPAVAAPAAVTSAATSVAQAATTLVTKVQTSAAAAAAAGAATQVAGVGEANSSCTDANDGQVICNGESQYGLCNRGYVYFQDVAAGMVCKDGKVVGAQ